MKYTFNKEGLIPVITQDSSTNEVLMLAYMNQEAIDKTLQTKDAYYFSRSRQALWRKGETSGNTQIVQSFFYDCDKDTILLKVKQIGPACHTGEPSCFYRSEFDESTATNNLILTELYSLIQKRKEDMPKDSYTTYLFEKGVDKILKKVAEETGEVIIAAKNNNEETIYEIGDLLYHLLVLMVSQGIELTDVYKELVGRKK